MVRPEPGEGGLICAKYAQLLAVASKNTKLAELTAGIVPHGPLVLLVHGGALTSLGRCSSLNAGAATPAESSLYGSKPGGNIRVFTSANSSLTNEEIANGFTGRISKAKVLLAYGCSIPQHLANNGDAANRF